MFFIRSLLLLLFLAFSLVAKLPNLKPQDVVEKMEEILKAHAQHKKLEPNLIKHSLKNYLEELDPTKSYFIESDIKIWLEPSDELLAKILQDYKSQKFTVFYAITDKLAEAISRRHSLEKQIDLNNLVTKIKIEEFKDLQWAKTNEELLTRLTNIKALQKETSLKLTDDVQEIALKRIEKRQLNFENQVLTTDPELKTYFVLAYALKALASSLDTHTAYFTPDEAAQFMIGVQQRLFGIGAQLRDDINGFTLIKIIDGGPAANGKELKVKDRIIAVNGEPVVGMDIIDAVDLIRGEENTEVILTIIRENVEPVVSTEKLDITVKRGEVILKESRFESSFEPFGEGGIGYLKLYSFYQDPDSSSAEDLEKELKKLATEQNLKGVILDLRSNSGGMLTQAVNVTGLFITKGTVVSIKDDKGEIQHLRHLDSKISWEGPLIVLVNRLSASASEIVAQTLQDYGRALIIGDDHTYGKGSFQTFTLNGTKKSEVNPKGEYKVTRGRYYTVSGKTPQLIGVAADIIVPGALSESEIGEKFGQYPLENDQIKANFDDDLLDIPYLQREQVKMLYKFNLQAKLALYNPYLEQLKKNSTYRINHHKNYQNFLKELKKKDDLELENLETFTQNDLQLQETYNIMRDLINLMEQKPNFSRSRS